MPKRERDEAVAELSSTVFATMLEEILMDVVQQSHQEIARARAVCDVCHTRCGAGALLWRCITRVVLNVGHEIQPVHVPGPSNGVASGSRISTPSGETKLGERNSPSGTGVNTPVNGKDGTTYFECLECNRQIAASRYAPHLSSCMGLGNRRGAARNASARSKLGNELGKAASPRFASEAGDVPDEPKSAPKGKGKSKAKKTDSTLNVNGKRTGSPSVSPTKKPSKKQKTAGSPAARVKADPDSPAFGSLLQVPSNASRIPSKLRASSTVSSLPGRERRSSSPESPSRLSSPARSISTQASTIIRSPAISTATLKSKQANGKGRGVPAPPRIPSPPRPPPPPITRMPVTDYLVDVEGEETGSSTDTDSD
ncbi:hypothetical protein C8Q74DRAFT_1291313 [Fomes fomentarius]|nr:hypothetical protein C8Q74DRAFT_1291313 [Fomes fomentarius]